MQATESRRINKMAFFADLGYEPHPGQLEIHRSSAPRRVVACGVRWGKTVCAGMEGLAAAMAPQKQSVGWVVAPTYDLADRVFRQIAITAAEHLRHRIVTMKEHERKLVIRNMAGGLSEIRGKSADNPVSLLGEGLDWLIVDEASRLRPDIWESHLSQRLLDKQGWALLISTPKGKGWFYELWKRGQGHDDAYHSWNYPSWTSPLLDTDLIEAERDRLPERVFMQEYGAEFIEGAGAVFRNVRDCAVGALQDPVEGERYHAGLDLAQVADYTVLVVMNEDEEVVFVDRFQRLDWAIQVARIKAALDRYNGAVVLVDATGAGAPVVESLLAADVNACGVTLTARVKSMMISNLALLLEQRQITLPAPALCPDLIDELESYQYSVSDVGNVRTGAPSGMHDDFVIALALAAWQAPEEEQTDQVLVF